jgi:MFS family permease
MSSNPGASLEVRFNGQNLQLTYSTGPDHSNWAVELDGEPATDPDSGGPLLISGYSQTVRYEVDQTILVDAPGEHILSLINTGERDPSSQGSIISLSRMEILPPLRISNLGLILALILAVELLGLLISFLLGKPLFSGLVTHLNTKRSILLSLAVYTVIAIWGFFLNSVIEFWCLAWMVAVVQGGSQALSRSLFASMSPASKSGEFFGLFGIMEKFSAVLGPLVFAFAATNFGSSRPAILSIIAFFIVGGYLLNRVNVEEGQRVARAEDVSLLGEAAPD